jgi:EAL domain-containing protein (putative c-di-GMP-specific phosphodiesterase class I)
VNHPDLLNMLGLPPTEPVHLRRKEPRERFVAFAFAGAELLLEADLDGTITYATGAFPSRYGKPPDAFIGARLSTLFAPSNLEEVEMALSLLQQRGRLMPMTVRLADTNRSAMAFAGILMPVQGRPPSLCLTLARLPEPSDSLTKPSSAFGFARAAASGLRQGTARKMLLLELDGAAATGEAASGVMGALERLAPDAQTSEIAPGRIGVLPGADSGGALGSLTQLRDALRGMGIDAPVTGLALDLSTQGLTLSQAAHTLRHALAVFARKGVDGLDRSGFGADLAGYIKQAGRKADILRRVMREGRYSFQYQPIVSLTTRRPHHFEALIRPAPIPELPLSGPQEFVMLVEALGLADELDLRVAQTACENALHSNAHIAFNISGQSVQTPGARQRLLRLLASHKATAAGLVMVEVTETAEIEDMEEATRTAKALRELGVTFCLDDFGAGTTDMRLLRALAPDIVKVDGSYVAGITTSQRERAFIAGMVEMVKAAGAKLVAERVETEVEADILAKLGVDLGQGWLFGRAAALPATPMPQK